MTHSGDGLGRGSMIIWNPPGSPRLPDLPELAEAIARQGTASALYNYRAVHGHVDWAYAHGERHDLWWEFTLSASFRWQAHVARMSPEFGRLRTERLAAGLGLRTLLDRPVEALTPSQRSRANLAVELLPQPDLLVWEEPLALLTGGDAARAAALVRSLVLSEGLTVIAISADPFGVEGLERTRPLPVAAAHI